MNTLVPTEETRQFDRPLVQPPTIHECDNEPTQEAATASYTVIVSQDPGGNPGGDPGQRHPPLAIAADHSSLKTDEGSWAINSGTWSGGAPEDFASITLSPSIGTVGKGVGTWWWWLSPDDGPTESQDVTITATNPASPDNGPPVTTQFHLTVDNIAPTVHLCPASGQEGSPVNVIGWATDPSAADLASMTYAWTVTNNGSTIASGSGPNISFLPDDNGLYDVTLTATDKDGGQDTATEPVNVDNLPPTPTLTGDTSGQEGSLTPVTLTGSATDPSPVDTAYGFTYFWTVTGGECTPSSGSTKDISFTPEEEGTYHVTFTAIDKDGGPGSTTQDVVVADAPLTAGGEDVEATVGVEVRDVVVATFTDADPQGNKDDYTAKIHWGDGYTSDGTISLNSDGRFEVTSTYTYATAETFTITVDIKDEGNAETSTTSTATVDPVHAELDLYYPDGTMVPASDKQNPGGVLFKGDTVELDIVPVPGQSGDWGWFQLSVDSYHIKITNQNGATVSTSDHLSTMTTTKLNITGLSASDSEGDELISVYWYSPSGYGRTFPDDNLARLASREHVSMSCRRGK